MTTTVKELISHRVERLHQARMLLGIPRADIAGPLKVSERSIGHWENDARNPSAARVDEWAEVLREVAAARIAEARGLLR